MWILTMPVISTAHVTEEADAYLRTSTTDEFKNAVAPWEGGYFIYVAGCEPHEGLSAVFDWALKNDYDWIRLDRDGDIVPELPQYNW
jgi:hypothetical protein